MNHWIKNIVSRFTKTNYVPSNYENLSKSQLIQKIQTLENRLKKKEHHIKTNKKPFDIKQYGERRIALKVAYLGWNYSGFAAQGDEITTPTVEGQIFKALTTCNLIMHPDQCQFTRCGRTDKGVSGLGQVIALNVRSKQDKLNTNTNDMPYIEIINRLLPEDIRILAWAPVESTFNARFDCKSRTYKYFFEKENLDLNLMKKAAEYMIGIHDFRNFCRLDPSKNITNYERNIISLNILHVENDFYQIELKGTAFLWHQVRCIMSILFLVGQKLENPEIIKSLLNVNEINSRPDYPMASDLPLLLYDCEYNNDIEWIYANEGNNRSTTPIKTFHHFHQLWSSIIIKGFLYKTVLNQIQNNSINNFSQLMKSNNLNQSTVLLGAGKSIRTAHYKPLLLRQRADSDAVKKEKYRLKQLNKKK